MHDHASAAPARGEASGSPKPEPLRDHRARSTSPIDERAHDPPGRADEHRSPEPQRQVVDDVQREAPDAPERGRPVIGPGSAVSADFGGRTVRGRPSVALLELLAAGLRPSGRDRCLTDRRRGPDSRPACDRAGFLNFLHRSHAGLARRRPTCLADCDGLAPLARCRRRDGAPGRTAVRRGHRPPTVACLASAAATSACAWAAALAAWRRRWRVHGVEGFGFRGRPAAAPCAWRGRRRGHLLLLGRGRVVRLLPAVDSGRLQGLLRSATRTCTQHDQARDFVLDQPSCR